MATIIKTSPKCFTFKKAFWPVIEMDSKTIGIDVGCAALKSEIAGHGASYAVFGFYEGAYGFVFRRRDSSTYLLVREDRTTVHINALYFATTYLDHESRLFVQNVSR